MVALIEFITKLSRTRTIYQSVSITRKRCIVWYRDYYVPKANIHEIYAGNKKSNIPEYTWVYAWRNNEQIENGIPTFASMSQRERHIYISIRASTCRSEMFYPNYQTNLIKYILVDFRPPEPLCSCLSSAPLPRAHSLFLFTISYAYTRAVVT